MFVMFRRLFEGLKESGQSAVYFHPFQSQDMTKFPAVACLLIMIGSQACKVLDEHMFVWTLKDHSRRVLPSNSRLSISTSGVHPRRHHWSGAQFRPQGRNNGFPQMSHRLQTKRWELMARKSSQASQAICIYLEMRHLVYLTNSNGHLATGQTVKPSRSRLFGAKVPKAQLFLRNN